MLATGMSSLTGQSVFVLPEFSGVCHPADRFDTATVPMVRPCAPIFIVGSPRSGTSIFTWCLGQHPNILVQEESNWLGSFANNLQDCFVTGSSRGERSQLSAMGVEREEFFQLMGNAVDQMIYSHRARFEALALEAGIRRPEGVNPAFCLSRWSGEPKGRWVDGTPENSFCIPGLRHLFPRGKFLHILRDVESVVKSLVKFQHRVVSSEEEAYRYWLRTVQACVASEQAYGSKVVMRIRYRDLVEEPEKTLKRCHAFLNEPFVPCSMEPLAVRINSSRAPADFDPTDPRTDPELRRRARQLSQELLAEEEVIYSPDPAKISGLEQDFVARARYVARTDADLDQALECLAKTERELAALRGVTSAEGARELVRSYVHYYCRVVVAVPCGEPVPYLNGREPVPLRLPAGEPAAPEEQEKLVAQLRSFREVGAGYLLLPQSRLASATRFPELHQYISSVYKLVGKYCGWALYVA